MPFVYDEVKDDPDFIAFVKTTTGEAVNTAVNDLKSKNGELLGEKKKLQELLSALDGIDPEKAKKAMEFLDNNEIARLIAEGKTEEALANHTEKLTIKYQEMIDNLTKERDESKTTASDYRSRFESTMVNSAIQREAIAAGILPDAIPDVLSRAQQVFSYGEDGSIEARDKDGNLVKKEDKLLTPKMWVAGLPRHYWPGSEGAGATGGGRGSDANEQLAQAASTGDHDSYRRLRRKQQGKK